MRSHINKSLKSSHASNIMSHINDMTCITYDSFTRFGSTGLRRYESVLMSVRHTSTRHVTHQRVMSHIHNMTCITYDSFPSFERMGLHRHDLNNCNETHINAACHTSTSPPTHQTSCHVIRCTSTLMSRNAMHINVEVHIVDVHLITNVMSRNEMPINLCVFAKESYKRDDILQKRPTYLLTIVL